MDKISSYLVSCLLQFILAVGVGIIVLVLEYRTRWFAKFVPRNSNNPDLDLYTRKKLFSWIETFVWFMFSIFVLGGSIYILYVSEAPKTVLDNPVDTNTVLRTITTGGTASFFGNELYITVEKVDVIQSRKEVSFIVGAPGYQNQAISNIGVGSISTFDFGVKYEIRVTSIGYQSLPNQAVDFTVTKLDMKE